MSYAMDLMEHWRTSCPPAAESLARLTIYQNLWKPEKTKLTPEGQQREVQQHLASLAMQTGVKPTTELPEWVKNWEIPEEHPN